ncbi:MAG: 16S rRNA (uracil(1498)-N(3))-methyltransferase [Candidatus Azobacteroides sp.]|nr:16S rRNA (uracil(1498)-N(3))-methyltransferase [Candidatus Azobacteroides sp.]
MYIFYTPHILTDHTLPEDESRHAVKVLRLRDGDMILQTDGQGTFYKTKIINAHQKHCLTEIVEVLPQKQERDFRIHIAVAPTKNMDRFEWFAEKATEIGIDEITPLRCRFSERKEMKTERIEKILVAGMKQSQKAFLPKLNPLVDFALFMNAQLPEQRFIAHCYEDISKIPLKDAYEKGKDVVILIGPEGDFSPDETELAVTNKFRPVSLGNSRLRTETAALVACHTIHLMQ